MPGKGQAKLQFMPAEVKSKVEETVGWLLSREGMQEPLNRYKKAVRDMTSLYTKYEGKLLSAENKAMDDIRKRLGNSNGHREVIENLTAVRNML